MEEKREHIDVTFRFPLALYDALLDKPSVPVQIVVREEPDSPTGHHLGIFSVDPEMMLPVASLLEYCTAVATYDELIVHSGDFEPEHLYRGRTMRVLGEMILRVLEERDEADTEMPHDFLKYGARATRDLIEVKAKQLGVDINVEDLTR